jgi:hypothetical protein
MLLRKYCYYQKEKPRALCKCLRAVDWTRNDATREVFSCFFLDFSGPLSLSHNQLKLVQVSDMLRLWAPLTPEDALDLLDVTFMDEQIRTHAVNALRGLSDNKLIAYLLQLTQVLKYESYFDCELARFLLSRALKNQRVGHFFFWYLRSEMHIAEVCFGLFCIAGLHTWLVVEKSRRQTCGLVCCSRLTAAAVVGTCW